jgi:hypothetical protein
MFFHPDPHDRDGLLSYTYEKGRDEELVEIPECVGKEISKHKKKQRLKCKTHRWVKAAALLFYWMRCWIFLPVSDLQ